MVVVHSYIRLPSPVTYLVFLFISRQGYTKLVETGMISTEVMSWLDTCWKIDPMTNSTRLTQDLLSPSHLNSEYSVHSSGVNRILYHMQ